MKKNYFLMIFATLIVFFASCTKNEFTTSYEDVQRAKFEQTFIQTFGQPATDHDWGFGSAEIVDLTGYSAEATRAATRGHNVNRNEWENQFNVPANVTAEERDLVVAEFSKYRPNVVNTENINWSDYFIYEVYKGEDVYKDGFGQDVLGSDHMNHLQVKKAEGDLLPPDNACWEHANDFNNADHNASWNNIKGATLMLNSGTLDFAYHNSTDSKYHSEYIIIAGAEIDPSLSEYYYIGFDFCASHPEGQEANKNMDVERNWKFNDFIIRVSPARFKAAKMIIAEDLGTSESDYDYNDCIIEATLGNSWVGELNANKLVAHITLKAAGGTLPLYVAGREVHELFGVPVSTMVNTGLVSRPYVSFTAILGDADWSNTKNIKDIPIVVETPNGTITLQSNVGQPSEKLCVDADYVWCREREPIQNKYPDFSRWITDKNCQWWKVE